MQVNFNPPPIVALAVLLVGVVVQSAPVRASDLELAMHYEAASESHYLVITNKTQQFLCVAEHVFDTRRGYIFLSSIDGQPIPLRSHADSVPSFYRGLDLAKAYLFLRPGEPRKMYIDLANFVTGEGTYEYRIVFPYYACTDIIDTRRSATQQEIATRAVDVSGKVAIPSKEN